PRPRPQIFTLPVDSVENQRSNSPPRMPSLPNIPVPQIQTTDEYLNQLIRNTEPFIDQRPTLSVEPQPLRNPFTSEYSPKILDKQKISKTNQYSENYTEPFTNKYSTTNLENRHSPTRQRSRSPTRRNQYPDQTIINVQVDTSEIKPLQDPFTSEYSPKILDKQQISKTQRTDQYPKPFMNKYSTTNLENRQSPTRQRSRSPTRRNQYPDETIINV
ncbi:MAG: hypothetical protein WCJ72_20465, partial [Chryseobacterium sp.]